MNDLEAILQLWRELESAGADYVLATIVGVEGSSYRRPGTHMLLAQDGRRAGTVSGGCLEGEVARKAWWLAASGPAIESYSTADDDGDRPYGSGCGGIVHLLLERKQTAGPLLAALDTTFTARIPLGIATVLEGEHIGKRAFFGLPGDTTRKPLNSAESLSALGEPGLFDLASSAFDHSSTLETRIHLDGTETRVWANRCAARSGLWICSAGDDAKPLARIARELGWFVAVLDGRSNLATEARFPEAHEVRTVSMENLTGASPQLNPLTTDAVVVMTHSFEQDSHFLAAVLSQKTQPAYIGVLGPQRRTRELLIEAARLIKVQASSNRIDRWLAAMHAPTGLDLGADTPSAIALAILAEIQKVTAGSTALPLREVRGAAVQPVACPPGHDRKR